ncbi:MAG: hypothetical protein AABW84_01150 [Nanoarchaeota archaeon]
MDEQPNTKPNMGKIVSKLKKVVKPIQVEETQPILVEETSLESIPRELFDKIAKEQGYAISKELAIAAEKQWKAVKADENSLSGTTKTYLEQTDKIRKEYDIIQASNQGSDSLDQLLQSVQTEEPKIPENYVSQEQYTELKKEFDELSKAFHIAVKNEERLEQVVKEYGLADEQSQLKIKKYETENELLQLTNTDLKAAIENAKVPISPLTDEEKDKQYQDEIKALKEENASYTKKVDDLTTVVNADRAELAKAYDTVTLLENRLHEYKLAVAGGTTQDLQTETEEESVQEGQEFSGTPSYTIHDYFGLVTVQEQDGGLLRYQPDVDGYVFDVDNKRLIHVGKDYPMFLENHEKNLMAYINGESDKSNLSVRKKRALDSEE